MISVPWLNAGLGETGNSTALHCIPKVKSVIGGEVFFVG